MNNPELKEGEMTKKLEDFTAQLPSKFYLCTAAAIMGISIFLKCRRHTHSALFLGQLVSPILIMGLYNKLVKIHGHDSLEKS